MNQAGQGEHLSTKGHRRSVMDDILGALIGPLSSLFPPRKQTEACPPTGLTFPPGDPGSGASAKGTFGRERHSQLLRRLSDTVISYARHMILNGGQMAAMWDRGASGVEGDSSCDTQTIGRLEKMDLASSSSEVQATDMESDGIGLQTSVTPVW